MLEGFVNANHEAVVSLPLQGPAGQTREVEAVIDTGYSGSLTLPPSLVSELDLPYAYSSSATLADNTEVAFLVHRVTVLWDGGQRHIETDAVGATPLVGMAMLDSHSLYVEVENGGRVIIQPRN